MAKPKVIPVVTVLAAKRGFVRTFAQSLATSLLFLARVTIVFTQDALLAAAVGVGGMLVSASINALQSFFDMVSKDVP